MAVDSFALKETFIPRGAKLPKDFGELCVYVSHHFVGASYVKVFEVPAGVVIGQHRHKMGHYSHLLIGEVRVHVEGEIRELKAPAVIYIEAEKQHLIGAVTDVLWACVWEDVDGATSPDEVDHLVVIE